MLEQIDTEILANRVGTLATIAPGGGPQQTAVWFIVQDDHILISINAKRKKARNLAANATCSLLIFHPQSDDYYAEVRGTATLIEDNDYRVADVIAQRYDADFRAFDQPGDGRIVIDIAPERIVLTDVRD